MLVNIKGMMDTVQYDEQLIICTAQLRTHTNVPLCSPYKVCFNSFCFSGNKVLNMGL